MSPAEEITTVSIVGFCVTMFFAMILTIVYWLIYSDSEAVCMAKLGYVPKIVYTIGYNGSQSTQLIYVPGPYVPENLALGHIEKVEAK